MSNPFNVGPNPGQQIGVLNSQNPVKTHFDVAHGGKPDHIGMTVPLQNGIPGAGAHKIEIDRKGGIFFDEIV